MSTLTVDVEWTSKMAFKAIIENHQFMLDADESVGGTNLGPRPKPLLMASLAGCTAMDVISILRKMKIEPTYFNVKAVGDVTEEHPKQYTRIHLIYEFRGTDLPMDKLARAIELSQEQYCGISATLKKSIEITSEIKILN
jgi:putative redox protein